MRKNIRQDDLFVRIGGDEFVLLFNHNTPDQVSETLGRISTQFVRVAPDKKVGLSYGIEMIKDSLNDSMNVADKRMYEMKMSRKRVGTSRTKAQK